MTGAFNAAATLSPESPRWIVTPPRSTLIRATPTWSSARAGAQANPQTKTTASITPSRPIGFFIVSSCQANELAPGAHLSLATLFNARLAASVSLGRRDFRVPFFSSEVVDYLENELWLGRQLAGIPVFSDRRCRTCG